VNTGERRRAKRNPQAAASPQDLRKRPRILRFEAVFNRATGRATATSYLKILRSSALRGVFESHHPDQETSRKQTLETPPARCLQVCSERGGPELLEFPADATIRDNSMALASALVFTACASPLAHATPVETRVLGECGDRITSNSDRNLAWRSRRPAERTGQLPSSDCGLK
jgi:hypothetical protein